MGKHFTRGFTIIETMLVLAITGMLVAGLFIGVGSSVNTQRYKDAVVTFKSFIQSQYSQVSDVTNTRGKGWTCDASATTTVAPNDEGIAPGQSDCVILGRYVSVVGGDIASAVVVGHPNSSSATGTDIEILKDNYTLGISTSSIETSTLEWGAQIAWPESGAGSRDPAQSRSISILVIRSPESGITYTLTNDTAVDIKEVSSVALENMFEESPSAISPQSARTICIDPNGVSVPEKLAVYIGQSADSASAIEVRSALLIEQSGGDSKC